MSKAGLLAAAVMAMAFKNEQSWGIGDPHKRGELAGLKTPTQSSGRKPTMTNEAKEKRTFKRKAKAKAAKKARRKNRRK